MHIVLGMIAGTCLYHGFKDSNPFLIFSGVAAFTIALKVLGIF